LHTEQIAGGSGEHLDRGGDHEDQKRHPDRGDHDHGDEASPLAEGDDVAVAGGGDRHRRVVEGVDGGDIAVDVPVAVAADENEDSDEQDQACGGEEAQEDQPQWPRPGIGEPDGSGRRSGVSGDDARDVRNRLPDEP